MRGLRCALAALLSLAAVDVAAQTSPACTTGIVFEDRDGDGRRDGVEPGLAHVAVSNGRDVIRSGADGRYHLQPRDGAAVFIIKPAGHVLAPRGDGLPDYWRTPGEGAACDFALRRENLPPLRKEGLRVLVFGDPQPKSRVDVGHYARGIVDAVIDEASATARDFRVAWPGRAADLGLTLGDVVDDDLSLYPGIKRETARLQVPWLHAPGNHDINQASDDDARSLAGFHEAFGPDSFAWEEPEASFVVLDDVIWQPASSPKYIGGLREDQFAFLEAYLRGARKDRLLVLSMHIPLFEPGGKDTFRDADRTRLFALLRGFPQVLLLTAHNHAQQHVFHGAADGWQGARPLHEYNVGATCGAFWSGVKDVAGVPISTMADGTPKGWARLQIQTDGRYALSYHPSNDPVRAMHLHAPKALRRGAYPAWGVYANVYMGMDDTRVEFRVDGSEWMPMKRVLQPDPALLAENMRDDEAGALRGYDRSPEAEPSQHLWRGALPTKLAAGEHAVEVRAFDRWRGEVRAKTSYRLIEAEP